MFVGISKTRSDSEDGIYIKIVQEAFNSYKLFKNFKRNIDYMTVLEHVSESQGMLYLDTIRNESPELLNVIESYKENDIVGNPMVYKYEGVGKISPTTLRYIKVSSDLKRFFGLHIGDRIVEIGGGYGGQALINDKTFCIKVYEILDLYPVLKLISKYLECHILKSSYKVSTLNQKSGEEKYDLVISNYAFSELPKNLQLEYIRKVLSKSRKGYLTMNSGRSNETSRSTGKMTLDQLKKELQPFEIFEETPLTGPDNYLIVWGHN